MPKGKQKKQSSETKKSLEPDSDVTQMLKLSIKKFKITMINILRTSIEKNRQHTRTDGQHKETDRNSRN